ncbi:MAG: GNAT family N-acetyltransferase [Pseudomonadales bacterium]|jgi:predicted GNAT family N-acyltransferase|nr:GNAT family N-acetyltransferase [Pseudomonadales bacterium]
MTEGVAVRIGDWDADAEALRAIRTRVFVEEQAVPREIEWDGQDEGAVHLVAEDHRGDVVGTARLLPSGQIGRMAVLPERRGFGIGRALLEAAVDAARDRGEREVFLNAQAHALGFYEDAGFHPVGPEFEEAGIAHRRMELALGITFDSPVEGPLEIVNAAADRTPYDHPALTDCEDAVRMLEGESAIAAAIVELATYARREILVLSQDLDPRYFDRPELLEMLSRFARRHGNAAVRILVHDTRRMIRDGHGLLDLGRRLSSSFDIRIVHPEMQDREDTFVLADRTGMVGIPRSSTAAGFLNLNDAPLTRQYANLWNRLNDRSVTDPNLRQMSI